MQAEKLSSKAKSGAGKTRLYTGILWYLAGMTVVLGITFMPETVQAQQPT